ncbi:glycosyltransferase family A protein [Flavobacterium yafengii]|uniref:glycosyltransferase family A protein n=1 Tax=Flavobacterium yafengii TaxID=3041253 RepID=UPI0024A8E0CF|nr:glycosyltransferase family A protein [Flavobacterium yafengii]MDI5898164.1 glycosyltransferase family A protein [Flavobacterium yafengii]
MRIGTNPEKFKEEKNKKMLHRVVVVFYIPNLEDEFYKESLSVLDVCLNSLVNTINFETTNITLINNNSSDNADIVVKKYLEANQIDKYVLYKENKGKVYAVLNEVRGIFEDFVTITDSDILFFDGWEYAVFDVFKNHPKAGVVSPYPCPYLTFYKNESVFCSNTIKNNIKYGKFVADEDIEMYIKGTNMPNIIDRKTNYNWKEKQYILKSPAPAIIGAYHVVATYRTSQFRNVYDYPEMKFKNSYEENFMDCLANKNGMYRLSTIKSYMYHMGNTIDDFIFSPKEKAKTSITSEMINGIKSFKLGNKYIVIIKRVIGMLFIRFRWYK